MAGGGWEVESCVEERHPRRMYEVTTLERLYKQCLESPGWAKLLEKYPGLTMSLSTFRKCLCKCCSPPQERSCVDDILSQQRYYQRAIVKTTEGDSNLQKHLRECKCEIHARPSHPSTLDWTSHLYDTPKDFVGLSMCKPVAIPQLKKSRTDDDSTAPKLVPWNCLLGQCELCGVDLKLKIMQCPVLKEYEKEIRVMEWDEARRSGTTSTGKKRTQKEPGVKFMHLAEVVKKLRDQSIKTAKHVGVTSWFHAGRDRLMETFLPTEIQIDTDFSAVPALEAMEKLNSSEANHCVLDVFIVRHSPREVFVVSEDGTMVKKRVCSTTYWAVVGPADSKGKSNDHFFHRACLDYISGWTIRRVKVSINVNVNLLHLWTDRCKGQYQSQYNFWDTAAWAKTHPGVRVVHEYCPKHGFKGNHDGHGKCCKCSWTKCECCTCEDDAAVDRIGDALAGYDHLLKERPGKSKEDWPSLELAKDPKLLARTPLTPTDVQYAYCTDDKEEYERLVRKRPAEHIIFCDRTAIPKSTGTLAGSAEFGSTQGLNRQPVYVDGREGWEFFSAPYSCHCIDCSEGNFDECAFKDI